MFTEVAMCHWERRSWHFEASQCLHFQKKVSRREWNAWPWRLRHYTPCNVSYSLPADIQSKGRRLDNHKHCCISLTPHKHSLPLLSNIHLHNSNKPSTVTCAGLRKGIHVSVSAMAIMQDSSTLLLYKPWRHERQ